MKKILLIIIAFICIFFVVSTFAPSDLSDTQNNFPLTGSEIKSEFVKLGKNEYQVYSFINNEDDENSEYLVQVIEKGGLLKNQYSVTSSTSFTLDFISNPDYRKIVDFPQTEIKTFFSDNYYGSVYHGVAPISCKKVTINGVEAERKEMHIDRNGIKADFVFFYCIIKQDEYPEKNVLICEDENGTSFRIIAKEGEKFAKIVPVGTGDNPSSQE